MREEERGMLLHGHVLPWYRRWLFSTDHKVIGLQYGFTALCFLLFGFSLMILMRLQLGWPGHAFGVMKWLGEGRAPGGVLLPEAYNQLGAMHGTIMVFLGVVFLLASSLLGSVNYIVAILQLRAKGMSLMRFPFFVWAQLVTSFLLLLAFPPLEAAGVLQLMDRLGGTSFFLPSGLVISGQVLHNAGGGNPLLWQHLFWFLAHPEVYVLILPAMGIVAEIIANNTRKPLWGYKAMVYSLIFLGFMSFFVWAHHMVMTGMGTAVSAFFQTTTMIISIPSVVILTSLLLWLWGSSIRDTTPMLFALSFLPLFVIE